ncbi:MAG: metal-dependent hydrolase, partial [Proteobacteria bacterium]|nr:metal-dependent hydrolase [Pseudomonadota bacterium]
ERPKLANYKWFANNLFISNVFTALSITFPAGEHFFMASVKDYVREIKDPVLKNQIVIFLAQESQHSKQHEVYNSWMNSQGFAIDKIRLAFEQRFAKATGKHSKIEKLALTCALEHMTALMAYALLSTPKLLELMDLEVRQLWIWHAIEELEHKAVAMEVYNAVGGTYLTRIRMMLVGTYNLSQFALRTQVILTLKAMKWSDLQLVFSGLGALFHLGTFFMRLVPRYLSYFARSFHPDNTDETKLIETWSKYLKENRAQ